ncbi:hypothetical protein EHE19_002790 [Ruminiclostridium herbifermentans]|uniref:Yip1 domain-containing protein n=1 Tax=Ruminiclostridium herbifermentans TaxID=2488810 RepID=A0A4V6ENX5_9FIRM|nr:hypothetical protein [Ruminiclostridium herbifermentans]QNU67471.1 hypothetical protein EHE19_002790 [Ruminiclostridium herbifermentans]
MKLNFNKLIDFFLLKKDFYSKLNDKIMWLYVGIVFVGLRDVFFVALNMNSNNAEFKNNFILDFKSIGMLILTALVVGFLDLIAFSYPAFDTIKHFKNRNESKSMSLVMIYSSQLTKVAKLYAIANVIVTPIQLLSYFIGNMAGSYNFEILIYISLLLEILAYFWFNGAITRGLCVLFKLPNNIRGIVFVLVFIWNALLGQAIVYLLNLVLVRL